MSWSSTSMFPNNISRFLVIPNQPANSLNVICSFYHLVLDMPIITQIQQLWNPSNHFMLASWFSPVITVFKISFLRYRNYSYISASFQSLTTELAVRIFLINTNNQCCNYVPPQNISSGKLSVLQSSPHFILSIATTSSSEVGDHQDSTLSPKKANHPLILDYIGWLYSVSY